MHARRSDVTPGSATQSVGTEKLVILYDGGCPMCRREIAHYRRVHGSERIEWVDITSTAALEDRFGVSRSDAMARFHARKPGGEWVSGAAGFVELWARLDGYRHLASGVRRLHLTAPLDWAYTRFARWRLRRRCATGACAAN